MFPGKSRTPAAPELAAAAPRASLSTLFVFSASLKAQEPQKWFPFNKYLLCSVLIFFKTQCSVVQAQPVPARLPATGTLLALAPLAHRGFLFRPWLTALSWPGVATVPEGPWEALVWVRHTH